MESIRHHVLSVVILTLAGCGMLAAEPVRPPDLADLVREKLRVERFSVIDLKLPKTELPPAWTVTVTYEGRPQVLRLTAHTVRGPAFQVLVQQPGGALVRGPTPPPRTYRGTVDGEPGSLVAASLLPSGLSAGILRQDGPRAIVLHLLNSPGSTHGSMTDDLGIPASTLSTYLSLLLRKKVVRRERRERRSLYFLRDEEGVAKVLMVYRSSFFDPMVDRAISTYLERS